MLLDYEIAEGTKIKRYETVRGGDYRIGKIIQAGPKKFTVQFGDARCTYFRSTNGGEWWQDFLYATED